jgi:DNA polymerase-3 subunit epsilon
LDGSVLLLDVETTGAEADAQVIELAVQFGFGDIYGDIPPAVRTWRFKPSVPIHPGAQRVHGISAVDLANELPFIASAQDIAELLDSALVLIGYNIKFDIDRLFAELIRAKIRPPDLKDKAIVDTLRLWHFGEPRTLAAAHRRFVGDDFADQHTAAADIAATGRVTLAMLDAFGLSGEAWHDIAEKCEPERKFWLGHTNHFRWTAEGDVVVVTFGKHKDAKLHELASSQAGYLKWMLKQDFPMHVMEVVQQAINRKGQAFLQWAATRYPPPAAVPGGDG